MKFSNEQLVASVKICIYCRKTYWKWNIQFSNIAQTNEHLFWISNRIIVTHLNVSLSPFVHATASHLLVLPSSKLRSLFNQLATITYAILTMVHSKRQLTFSAGIMSALEVFYVFIYLSVGDFSHLQHS